MFLQGALAAPTRSSDARSPGTRTHQSGVARDRAMVTRSFISVPHFAHRAALSSLRVVNLIILDTRPLPQGCSAVSSPPPCLPLRLTLSV